MFLFQLARPVVYLHYLTSGLPQFYSSLSLSTLQEHFLPFPQDNTLDYYTGDDMIVGPGDEKVANAFDIFLRHIQIKG